MILKVKSSVNLTMLALGMLFPLVGLFPLVMGRLKATSADFYCPFLLLFLLGFIFWQSVASDRIKLTDTTLSRSVFGLTRWTVERANLTLRVGHDPRKGAFISGLSSVILAVDKSEKPQNIVGFINYQNLNRSEVEALILELDQGLKL